MNTKNTKKAYVVKLLDRSYLDILANFNLLRALEIMFFGPLFLRIYGHNYFSLFQVLVEN